MTAALALPLAAGGDASASPARLRAVPVLRPYQRACVDALFGWCAAYEGNPLGVLPTGAGKSLVMGTLAAEAIQNAPATRVLVLAHRAELISQNTRAVASVLPLGSIGVYSAGLRKRDLTAQVTVAGIQSISRHAYELGAVDLILIDEAHLVPATDDTMYRKLVDAVRRMNPAVRFIGLTATPYRLGSGLLHRGKNPLFTDIAYDAPVRELIDAGYLCRLISKATIQHLDTSRVATRGGEFVAAQLEAAVDVADTTAAVVREVQSCAAARRKMLVFCAGVSHAEHVADAFADAGWPAAAVHGELSSADRADRLEQFRGGALRVLTSVDVLTTGYDEPSIDCIVMLRPTKSTGLYVQMVGRGFRLHPNKTDTLVLDFAENVARHGPVDAIEVREKPPTEGGAAPTKTCPGCREIMYASLRVCPACGHAFPAPEAPPILPSASLSPILTSEAKPVTWHDVTSVEYFFHQRDESKTPTLRVEYMHGFRRVASEWVCLAHDGFARRKAERWWDARSPEPAPVKIDAALELVSDLLIPTAVATQPDGQYTRVVEYRFTPKSSGLPRACWTCEHGATEGYCAKWDAAPPADVQRTGCDDWTDEPVVPF